MRKIKGSIRSAKGLSNNEQIDNHIDMNENDLRWVCLLLPAVLRSSLFVYIIPKCQAIQISFIVIIRHFSFSLCLLFHFIHFFFFLRTAIRVCIAQTYQYLNKFKRILYHIHKCAQILILMRNGTAMKLFRMKHICTCAQTFLIHIEFGQKNVQIWTP